MMLYQVVLLYFIIIHSAYSATLPLHPLKSTREAHTALLVMHAAHPYTFFCSSLFSSTGTVHTRDCPTCGIIETKIKWFYIVPPEVFAKHLSCYSDKRCVNTKGKWYKGKACCDKQSPMFQMMNRDLFNFAPEVPELAKLRQHRQILPMNDSAPNQCAFLLNKKSKTLYIDPAVLGFVARTFLYMLDTYSLELPYAERAQYEKWHYEYPPSDWERLRNQKIKAIQGNENLWVSLKN